MVLLGQMGAAETDLTDLGQGGREDENATGLPTPGQGRAEFPSTSGRGTG